MTATDRPGICLAGLLPAPLAPTQETVRAAVDAAVAAGFTEMSTWTWLLPFLVDDGTLVSARAALDRKGLHVRMVETATAWATDASDDEARADAASMIAAAEDMGASLLMAVCLEPAITDRERARARLADLADGARAVGAQVCVEFLPWSGIPRIGDAWEMVAPLDDVGLIVDTWHWQRQPGGPDAGDLKGVPADRVVCLQLADAPVQATGELMDECMTSRLLPGDGEVDFAPIVEWLKGAAPFVAPEVFNGGLVTSRGVGAAAKASFDAAVRVMGG